LNARAAYDQTLDQAWQLFGKRHSMRLIWAQLSREGPHMAQITGKRAYLALVFTLKNAQL